MNKLKKKKNNKMGLRLVSSVGASAFVHENLASYGHMTIQNRVVPDFRDGLKPVQRRALWSAYKMGLNKNFVKSARLVGDILGKYHPHGDQAVYGAVVTMVNTPTPLFEGQGNWGNVTDGDSAASMRYTELKISQYSNLFMLNDEYMESVPLHATYDGSELQPLYLPSLLPTMFMLNSEGIAVGMSFNCPAFTLESIAKLTMYCLNKNIKPTPKLCAKMLEMNTGKVGGVCTSSDVEYLQLFKTSKSRLEFEPVWECDPKTRKLIIKSSAPGLSLANAMERVGAAADVMSVENRSAKNVHWEITFKPSHPQSEIKKLAATFVAKYFKRAVSYSVSGTERRIDDPNSDDTPSEFFYGSVTDMIERWLEWRVWLETDMLTRRLARQRAQLHKTKIIMLAAANLVALAKVLSTKSSVPLEQRVAKLLKITTEDAGMILSMSMRSLSNLEMEVLLKKKKEILHNISNTKSSKAKPGVSASTFTKELVSKVKLV